MTISRRTLLAAGGLAAAPTLLRAPAVRAQAQPVMLRLHHFLPAASNAHAGLLAPWAKRLEAASDGRLRIQIFPSMQLGGTPAQLYDQARDGVVDMVYTLPGYTPGRFPATEVFELPFIADRRSAVNSPAAWEFAQGHMGEQTGDVKLLCYWCHDGGVIHATRKVTSLADLKGMRLRFPTRLAGEALKAAGAAPIGMPVTQVAESITQRVLDGAVVPWEVAPSIKLPDLARNHLEIAGSPTLYTASFFVVMNKARYEGLPAELRAVIDAHAGLAFSNVAGGVWDQASASVEATVRKGGRNVISQLPDADKATWMKACEPIAAQWIDEMNTRKLDGRAMVENAKALLAKYAG
ncbi:MAG: TRAP transporter substrate-binding protein [Beijerinckiaceae bacterium]|nr:TRAP transporter substrate-binding protein [Beijerinckiaceae bacterium]